MTTALSQCKYIVPWADLGMDPGESRPLPPFCGLFKFQHYIFNMESRHLLNLSIQNALDLIHLRELQSQKFSWRSMCPKLPEKFAVHSPDGQYYAHIDSVYYIYRPPLSRNPSSAPVYSSACTRYESQVMWSSRLSVSNVSVILLVQLRPSLTRGTHKLTILHASKSIV